MKPFFLAVIKYLYSDQPRKFHFKVPFLIKCKSFDNVFLLYLVLIIVCVKLFALQLVLLFKMSIYT